MRLNFLSCAILIHNRDILFQHLCREAELNQGEVTKGKEQRENRRCYFLLIVFIFILFVFFAEILRIYRRQEVDGSVFEFVYHGRY